MKNLLRLGVVMLWVSIIAVPAIAEFKIGGYIAADAYAYRQDKEGFALPLGIYARRTTPGSGGIAGVPDGTAIKEEDRLQTYFDLNHSSHIWFRWTNEQGVGIFITPYLNGDPTQTSPTEDLSGYKYGFRMGISNAVGWWDITSKLRIVAGKGGYDTIFSSSDPGTTMGYDGICKVLGIGYGNIVSSYQNGIQLAYKFAPWISVKLGLIESRLTDNKSPNDSVDHYFKELLEDVGVNLADLAYHDKPMLKEEAGTKADNVTVLPKLEMAVPVILKFSDVLLILSPSAMYMQQSFDNIADGADDTIVSYGYALGTQLKINSFSLKTELTAGQNFKNAGRIGVATCYPFKAEYAAGIGSIQSARADSTGKVYDSETVAGWAEVRYNVGRFEPALYYGLQAVKRDMPGADSEATTQFYGFNCDIHLVGNFTLNPEFMVYDNGEGELMGTDVIFGKEVVTGMQLKWRF